MPGNAVGWFTPLRTHLLIGLTLLNTFVMVNFVPAGVVFLVLYADLRENDRGFTILTLILASPALRSTSPRTPPVRF